MSGLGLGAWDPVVRDVAGHDFERAQRVARWPVVEVLHAYMAIVRRHAADSYRHKVTIWAMTLRFRKDKQQPKAPAILDE